MLKINIISAPDYWKAITKKVKNYDALEDTDEGKKARRDLRAEMIVNQKGICAYCCKSIEMDNSLIEHIKPRDKYPKETLDCSNLIVSCKEQDTCGMAKANKYDSRFISPLTDDIDSHFAFSPDGTIVCLTERAKYTCELLNLNAYKLKKARAAKIRICRLYDNRDMILQYYLYNENGFYQTYADIILYYCNHPEL